MTHTIYGINKLEPEFPPIICPEHYRSDIWDYVSSYKIYQTKM